MFHVRESEGANEPMTTTAAPRTASMNAIIDNVVMHSKTDLSGIDFTNKIITLQYGPIQHVTTENKVEDDRISSNFLICYSRRRNASLRFVEFRGLVDGGERSDNA